MFVIEKVCDKFTLKKIFSLKTIFFYPQKKFTLQKIFPPKFFYAFKKSTQVKLGQQKSTSFLIYSLPNKKAATAKQATAAAPVTKNLQNNPSKPLSSKLPKKNPKKKNQNLKNLPQNLLPLLNPLLKTKSKNNLCQNNKNL